MLLVGLNVMFAQLVGMAAVSWVGLLEGGHVNETNIL